MAYQTNTARAFDYASSAPQLGVLEGAGLDARARQGASTDFFARIILVAVSMVVVVALCLARVWLTSSTAVVFQESASMRSDIRAAQNLADELQIETSRLSAASRIERIATQSYGMVAADDEETYFVDMSIYAPQDLDDDEPVVLASVRTTVLRMLNAPVQQLSHMLPEG